jgi:hypothetical protein
MRLLVIAILFLLIEKSTAQEVPTVEAFELVHVNNEVSIFFTIGKGYTCNGIDILRSDDGVVFTPIGDISGVCGSITSPISYSFVDNQPIQNKMSYYKLNLGGLGFSDTKSIIVLSTTDLGYILTPNPLQESGVLHFSNVNNELFEMQIVDLRGQLVQLSSTREQNLTIKTDNLPIGFYTFVLRNESSSTVIRGKFEVIR